MTTRQSEIIGLIRKEVKPALGCTEPIAVALAVAKAMEILQEKCPSLRPEWRMKENYSIRIEVSGNILKNGMLIQNIFIYMEHQQVDILHAVMECSGIQNM